MALVELSPNEKAAAITHHPTHDASREHRQRHRAKRQPRYAAKGKSFLGLAVVHAASIADGQEKKPIPNSPAADGGSGGTHRPRVGSSLRTFQVRFIAIPRYPVVEPRSTAG